jgi:hypothetical protein
MPTIVTGVLRGLVLCLGAAALPAFAADTAQAPAADTERMREGMQTLLSQLAESGALGQHPEQVSLRVDAPAQRVSDVGVLVDSTSAQSARDGLHVLGATPGSTADRLGLRPGDVIVAINGTSLRGLGADERGRALAATTMRHVVDDLPATASVAVEVVRGGDSLALTAPLHAVQIPAMHVELGDGGAGGMGGASEAGCGRISSFDVAPRGEHQYGVRILLLDGSTPGPSGTSSFRVAAGEHHLLVAENIPTRAFGIGEIATRRRQTSKPLTVVVEPGMTALIAAQLHLDKASDLAHGGYWDPVVWRQIAEPCR